MLFRYSEFNSNLKINENIAGAKKILKDTFRGLIPDSVIDRSKLALKNSKIVENQIEYRKDIVKLFLESSKYDL